MRKTADWPIALLFLIFIAGCTGGSLDLADLAPQTAGGGGPRYGDNKPHDWQNRAPWTYPVHGTDVSKYQRSVDWEKAKASGISFAFIKATEGGDRLDDYFHEHWRRSRAAGIPRSAYHFFYFCRPAIEQAQWFIQNVPRETSLPHVLDMEWNPLSPTCRTRPSPATVRAEMRVFLDAVTRHYGKRPIIYTSIDFYEDNDLGSFKGYEWWLRSVSAHPNERYGSRQPFLFWQYTGTGVVPGITGDADINVFNGSRAQWAAWLKANAR